MNHKPAAGTAVALLLALSASACASAPPLTADDAAFAGLDEAEVREALSLQAGWLDSQPVERRAQIAQDAALELGACRAIWSYLQSWDTTGSAPGDLVLPQLSDEALAAGQADPRENRHPFSVNFDWIGADDRAAMIDLITAPATCAWIPESADTTGPFIHDLAVAAYGDSAR